MFAYEMLDSASFDAPCAFYGPLTDLLGRCPAFPVAGSGVSPAALVHVSLGPVMEAFSEVLSHSGGEVGVLIAASSREQVERAWAMAMRLGAAGSGGPSSGSRQISAFYACYFQDPFGNRLCVCHFEAAPGESRAGKHMPPPMYWGF